jgi:ElaB/YqjD/DUF883 family membrane-anchored ribosome-binding protein
METLESVMNIVSPKPPATPSADPEISLDTDPDVVVTTSERGLEPEAPLVDDALTYVAEREDGFGISIADELRAIRGEVESLSHRAGDRLSTNFTAAQKQTVRSARGFIHQNPIPSLGFAALMGFVVGSMRRR